MKCWLRAIIVAVAVLMTCRQLSAAQLTGDSDETFERLEAWLVACVQHQPGVRDEPLRKVSALTNSDGRALWLQTTVVAQLARNFTQSTFQYPWGPNIRARMAYSEVALNRLRLLACAAGGRVDDFPCVRWDARTSLTADLLSVNDEAARWRQRGDDNFVLRKGALLETDIAMLGPAPAEASSDVGGLTSLRIDVTDGTGSNLGNADLHWEMARTLLSLVRPAKSSRPAPERDDDVRQWYQATAMWMQSVRRYEVAHLSRALRLFPNDPDLLFLRATLHEIEAGPMVQNAAKAFAVPAGYSTGVESQRAELKEAKDVFRRAIAGKPNWPEAHLHLGRVLAQLGENADAAKEVRIALGSSNDPIFGYYGSMFLGAIEEAAGHFDAARSLYRRAAAAFPRAQTPLLALAQLARRRNDRQAAQTAMQAVFELPRGDTESLVDPWWTYYVSHTRSAEDRITAVRRRLADGP